MREEIVLGARHIPKVWGHEEVIVNNEKYCLKKLVLKAGYASSLHMHNLKDESFYIESGMCMLLLDGITHEMRNGMSIRIRPGAVHRFWKPKIDLLERGISDDTCVIIEVSTHHSDNDVVRMKASHKL